MTKEGRDFMNELKEDVKDILENPSKSIKDPPKGLEGRVDRLEEYTIRLRKNVAIITELFHMMKRRESRDKLVQKIEDEL